MRAEIKFSDNLAGLEAFAKRIEELQGRLADPQPMLHSIGQRLLDATRQGFERGTTPDGRPWSPLAQDTVARKSRSNLDPRILIAHGILSESVDYKVGSDYVEIGTNITYGKYHMTGTSRGIESRPFLGLPAGGASALQDILTQHLQFK